MLRPDGGRRVDAPVENLDIVPTVLDYLGLASPELDGQSLRPWIEGRAAAAQPVFSAQTLLRSVDDGRWKLILDVETGAVRLHDLRADPLERNDVSENHPEILLRLRAALDQWMAEREEASGTPRTIEGSRAVEKRLEALGYLQ